MDKRIFQVSGLRAEEEDGRPVIRGVAVLYNRETNIGPFREVVRPGALTKTLKERDQMALWNHESGKPLGRKSANTLILDDREDGLHVTIIPGNRSWDKDAVESIARGDVQGMSFGFEVVTDNVIREDGKPPLVELRELKLWEVSPVTFPAYAETSVSIRSAVERYQSRFAETTQEPGTDAPHSDAPSGDLDVLQRKLTLAQCGV